jgi:hypothetical protein
LSIFPLQITPELIRSVRGFMARSSQRDAINDEARISAVERSINLALESLHREKSGLIRRVKRAVVGLLNISTEVVAVTNTPAFARVERRIRSLERQTDMFQRIKALLD